ncbi:MAG: glycoside hydrolase family 125 protein [Bacilli bacterium]|nr:glycoside hydrolase family 125 protein [Bacilli bacterium]
MNTSIPSTINFDNVAAAIRETTKNDHLVFTFNNCFYDTWKKAIKWIDDEVFLITGDIPAMWLRDSSVQVMHYLPFSKEEKVGKTIKALIKRQLRMISIDPYANAFKENENSYGEWDLTAITNPHSKIVWERKFELDSLCYPLWLVIKYYEYTGDKEVFSIDFFKAFDVILKTLEIEQNHEEKSDYYFGYTFTERQKIECKKNSVNPETYGLVWTGFRPSDDVCQFHYHIPDNMLLVTVLTRLENIFKTKLGKNEYAETCSSISSKVKEGINRYGIVNLEGKGRVYVSETDCHGHFSTNDDANIPSLLSIPYLEYPYLDKEAYENTRKLVLSKDNDYYYEGTVLKGIGSPHTPKNTIWPLSILMQGITSTDKKEIDECLSMVLNSDNGTNLMHESINKDDASIYTRAWFGWANSLFAEFCLKKILRIEK